MLEGARLAVVVPAYNEERLLPKTISTLPAFVDEVIIVDDASRDATFEVAQSLAGGRVRAVQHAVNRGVGAAIMTGYRLALDSGADVIAVMAGDAQMHPDDLERLALPVARGLVDYAKGNRFCHPDANRIIPFERALAGRVLSSLTRRAAGLETLSDSQCGFTAISARAVRGIDLNAVFSRFGYPNDLLGKLVQKGFSVLDVPVRPVYGDEDSGIRPWHVIVILGLIARIAWSRQRGETSRTVADSDSFSRTNSLTLRGESGVWCGPPKEEAHVEERSIRDAASR